MRPSRRRPVSKHKSAREFRRNSRKTKSANMQHIHRGGWRL